MHVLRPHRVTRTYTQHLSGTPAQVFPLLCPTRETEWIEGWEPLVVISHSGVAEPGCVFVTAAMPHNAIWFISRHEPEQGFIEMLKFTPEVTMCQLRIQLAPTATGTAATVTYCHTSLGPEGDRFVAGFSEEFYQQFMREWESRLNHFLATGERLKNTHR